VRKVIRLLANRKGEPDGRHFYEHQKGLLCAVVTLDGSEDWTITYYIASDGRLLLLTVFRSGTGNVLRPEAEVKAELDRAVEYMERARANGDDVGEI